MQITAIDQSSLFASLLWADGTVIHNGYLYAINYGGDDLIKVNLNDLSDATVRDMSGDVGFAIKFVLGITEVGGYLYFADHHLLEHQPHLFKINASTMAIVDSWEIFSPLVEGMNGGDAICSDSRYVYIGGYEKDVVKFDTQTEEITTLSIVNVDFHSICVDDDYIWANNKSNDKLYKIDKALMVISGSVTLPDSQKECDDIEQDDNYVYNAGEQHGSAPYGIRRIKKSDLSVETIYPGGEEGYDGILRIGTELFVPICQVASDEKYYIRRIDLDDFNLTETLTLLGMADNPSKKMNDILTDGDYVYVTLYTGDPSGFQVFKFNKAKFIYGANPLLQTSFDSKQYLDLSSPYIPFTIQCKNAQGAKTNPDSINLYIYENTGTILSAFSSAFGLGFDRSLMLDTLVFDSADYSAYGGGFGDGFGGGVRQINDKTGFYGIFVPKNLLSGEKQYHVYWEYTVDSISKGKQEKFSVCNSTSFQG